MNINEELKQYTWLMPHRALLDAIKGPKSICPEKIASILPSIRMGTDGPMLDSLFLVSNQYLCEVRLIPKREDFDFIALNTIFNYRFELSEHIVKKANEDEIRYQTAKIVFLHRVGFDFKSELNYTGDNREAWIQAILKAIPLQLLLSSKIPAIS